MTIKKRNKLILQECLKKLNYQTLWSREIYGDFDVHRARGTH